MTKPTSLQHGKTYHIYARGTNRETIFHEARNYAHFLNLYRRYVAPIADTYAYCLLKNHWHLLVRIKTLEELAAATSDSLAAQSPHIEPSQAFSNLLNAYVKAINGAHNRTGSLFQHPFGRIEVSDEQYFARLVVYIHRNPQKHGLIEDFRDWEHSSYQTLLSHQPTKLCRADVLAWFGDPARFSEAHRIMPASPAPGWLNTLIEEDFD